MQLDYTVWMIQILVIHALLDLSRLFESCSDLLLSIVLTQYVKYSRLDRLVVWSPPSLSSKPEAVSRAGPKYSKWTRPLTSRYRLLRSHQTVYVTFHTVKQRNKRLQCSCKIDNSIFRYVLRLVEESFFRMDFQDSYIEI